MLSNIPSTAGSVGFSEQKKNNKNKNKKVDLQNWESDQSKEGLKTKKTDN